MFVAREIKQKLLRKFSDFLFCFTLYLFLLKKKNYMLKLLSDNIKKTLTQRMIIWQLDHWYWMRYICKYLDMRLIIMYHGIYMINKGFRISSQFIFILSKLTIYLINLLRLSWKWLFATTTNPPRSQQKLNVRIITAVSEPIKQSFFSFFLKCQKQVHQVFFHIFW